MFCTKCGNKIDDDAVFCPACGQPVSRRQNISQNETLNAVSKAPKKNKLKSKNVKDNIIGVVLVFLILAITVFMLIMGSNPVQVKNYMAKAEGYMESEDYWNAEHTYEYVLQMDDKKVDAYIGQSKACVAMADHMLELYDGDEEYLQEIDDYYIKAIEVLDTGYEKTEDDRLLEVKEDIINDNIEKYSALGYEFLDDEKTSGKHVSSDDGENSDDDSDGSGNNGSAFKKKWVPIKRTYYNSNGSINYYEEYELDSEGRIIRSVQHNTDGSSYVSAETNFKGTGFSGEQLYYNSKGELHQRRETTYDDNDNLLESITYNLKGDIFKYRYEYDSKGNLIAEYDYDCSGRYYSKCEYQNDSYGNAIKGEYYDSDGVLYYSTETVYEYDHNGNILKLVSTGSEGQFEKHEENEYDSRGNLLKRIEYDSEGNIHCRDEHEYDYNDNCIETIYYNPDGTKGMWYSTEYTEV